MATSIFFTESKDFKLIKDRILTQEDNYLVYVYADTTNIRIPRELIMQLPRYGNNLIWVDTAEMDSSDLSHHIVLTIGQLMHPEEEIEFFIVSRSSKLEKTIIFLRNEGIPAEIIAPSADKQKAAKSKGTGRRGRPRKVQTDEKAVVKTGKRGRPRKEKPAEENAEAVVKTGKRGRPKKVQAETAVKEAVIDAPKKRRGRPSLAKNEGAEAVPAEPKKRGRKPSVKPVKEKKAKKVKAEKKAKVSKPRKQRVDQVITEEMIQEKLGIFNSEDANLSLVLTRLFSLKKVARPKFEPKLIDLIKDITLEDDTIAEQILAQLQGMQIVESKEPGGRVYYKD